MSELFSLPDMRLVRLFGADALDWLQGQVTNDVRPLAQGVAVSFCICTPKGQLEAVCDGFMTGESILVSLPEACLPALLARVRDMVIMEEVEAEVLPQRLTHAIGADGLDADFALSNRRVEVSGIDLWSADPIEANRSNAEFDIRRLTAGTPVWGRDLGPKTLPPEMGTAFSERHISYRKGCYVGQEILMRIHSRGHTNQTWTALRLEAPASAGDPVRLGERTLGVVTSSVVSPSLGPIAGAMIRNENAQDGARLEVGNSFGMVATWPL